MSFIKNIYQVKKLEEMDKKIKKIFSVPTSTVYEIKQNLENINYDVDLSDGVITFKNINTTLGFVRYNAEAEVEYIFVNPMFRRQGLAKKLLSILEEKTKIKPTPQDPISPLGEKLFKVNKQDIN